jgi:hypothetical protein
MTHHGNESLKAILLHGWFPVVVATIVLVISVTVDLRSPGMHWTQRAGSAVIVIGAYVAYVGVKRGIKYALGSISIRIEPKYNAIAAVLVIVGTLLAGYGDLLL